MRAIRAMTFARLALPAGCLALGLAGASCQSSKKGQAAQMHQYIKDQIEDLGNANVPKEVEAAVNKGDYRFVGINDLGIMVPGVDDSDLKVAQSRYGVRVIENTTPAPRTKEQEQLQSVAWGYALQYNKLLRGKIPVGR